MTIQAQTPRKVHTADGVQTTFAYDFLIFDQSHLFVYEDDVLTTKSYTVTGVGNPSGGTVVFSPTVPANGVIVALVRNVPLTQEVDYRPYDPFPAETHESALDKLTQITQQLQDEVGRALRGSVSTPEGVNYTVPIPSQDAVLAWENSPTPTALVNGPTTAELEQWKNEANASASAAAASQSAAAASEAKAKDWAEKTNGEVDPGQFSAKYWAQQAQSANLNLANGNLMNPLLHMPLNNCMSMAKGTGKVRFTRSTVATYIDRYGIYRTAAIDEPRFEKDGLLMEGQNTNLLLHNTDLSNAVWDHITARWTTTHNSTDIAAPDGSNTATKKVAIGTPTAETMLRQNFSSPTGDNTGSIFIYVPTQAGITQWGHRIDLQDLETGNETQHTVFDRWLRVQSYILTGQVRTWIDHNINVNGGSVPPVGFTFYMWRPQHEQFKFMTSVIETGATAVTRDRDICKVDYQGNTPVSTHLENGSLLLDISYIGRNKGIAQFAFQANIQPDAGYRVWVPVVDAVRMQYQPDGSGQQYGVDQSVPFEPTRYGMTHDDQGNVSVYKNGVFVASGVDSDGITAIGTDLNLGHDSSEAHSMYGHIRNLRIYDRILTVDEMRVA